MKLGDRMTMKKWFIFRAFVSAMLIMSFSVSLHAAPRENGISHSFLENLARQYVVKDETLRVYLPRFPLEQYEIVHSRALGDFYVEKASEDMIKKVIREGWHREWHLAKYFRDYARPGSVAIDIGAHIGTHTVTLSHAVGPSGTVHAFEPQLKIFTELMVNMALNDRENVILHRHAVGSVNGWVEMNPSSIFNEGGCSVGSGGDKVEMVRLDDLHLDNVSLIKIDVEGLEMEVLDGAKATIQRNRPVIFIEILGHAGYESASIEHKNEVDKRIRIIEALGYTVSCLGMADFICIPNK